MGTGALLLAPVKHGLDQLGPFLTCTPPIIGWQALHAARVPHARAARMLFRATVRIACACVACDLICIFSAFSAAGKKAGGTVSLRHTHRRHTHALVNCQSEK